MSDVYFKDTKKAMREFDAYFSDIKSMLSEDFKEAYQKMTTEVDGILSEYDDKLIKIEELEEKIEELED